MRIPVTNSGQNKGRNSQSGCEALRPRDKKRLMLRTTAFLSATSCLLSLSLIAGCATRTATNGSAPPSPSTAPDQSAWQTAGSATSAIEVKGWAKPESGWLYVLDPQPIPHSYSGLVWLLDPATAKVMGAVSTGSDPDFALSPDGTRLYVASDGKDQQSNIAVIDTSSGAVIAKTSVENRVVAASLPPYSSMAVSGDGLVLRVLVTVPKAPDTDGFQLLHLMLAAAICCPVTSSGNCGYGRFIDYATADEFDFLPDDQSHPAHPRGREVQRARQFLRRASVGPATWRCSGLRSRQSRYDHRYVTAPFLAWIWPRQSLLQRPRREVYRDAFFLRPGPRRPMPNGSMWATAAILTPASI